MLVPQVQEWLQIWEKVLLRASPGFHEQPCKRSKKNDDKSAVAMLKKNDVHENIWQLVVNRDKNHDRPGRPDKNRDTCHECWTSIIERTTIGLCLSRHEAAEVFIDFSEELRHTETDPMRKTHETRRTSRGRSRPKSFARNDLSR